MKIEAVRNKEITHERLTNPIHFFKKFYILRKGCNASPFIHHIGYTKNRSYKVPFKESIISTDL